MTRMSEFQFLAVNGMAASEEAIAKSGQDVASGLSAAFELGPGAPPSEALACPRVVLSSRDL